MAFSAGQTGEGLGRVWGASGEGLTGFFQRGDTMDCLDKYPSIKTTLWILLSILFFLLPVGYGYPHKWTLENYYSAYSIWGVFWAIINYIIVYRQKIMMNKYSNVYKLIEKYDSDYLRDARDYSRKHSAEADSVSSQELLNKIDTNEAFHRSVIYLFNFWEVVYRMIEYKTVDKEWTRLYFCQPFLSNYDIYKPWLEKTTSDKAKDKYGKEAIENLYKLWSKYRHS